MEGSRFWHFLGPHGPHGGIHVGPLHTEDDVAGASAGDERWEEEPKLRGERPRWRAWRGGGRRAPTLYLLVLLL